MQDRSGIEAAGKQHAEREVGGCAHHDRRVQAAPEPLPRGLGGLSVVLRVRRIPPGAHAGPGPVRDEEAPGSELLELIHERGRARHVAGLQQGRGARARPGARRERRQECGRLGGEQDAISRAVDEERLLAEPIPGEEEGSRSAVGDREGEGAAQQRQAPRTETPPERKQDFAVGAALEVPASHFLVPPEFGCVVDFSVDDYRQVTVR